MAWLKRDETTEAPWYADGLRFACQQCGRCCGGAPGYVWVNEADIEALARHLGLESDEFQRIHVQRLWQGMSLSEKPNYDCVMLDGAGRCTAYPVRPAQCRTWPFWPGNLRSRAAWDDAGRRCAGIGKGPRYSYEQIEALRMEMAI